VRAIGAEARARGNRGARPARSRPVVDDPTFAWRAPLGVLALVWLAVRDRRRSGTWDRARELAVLVAVAAATMLHAVVHDLITWNVSRDWFAVGKALPEAARSFAPVVPLALLAGWTAGLVVGLVLLVANDPSRHLPRLGYRALAARALAVWWGSIVGALAFAGGALATAPAEHAYAVAASAHLGSYSGGLATLAAAAVEVGIRRVSSIRH
jgi:hypothetical protein